MTRTGIMVGYAVNGKGWHILMDDDGEVVSSQDVVFDEYSFPGSPWYGLPGLIGEVDLHSDDGEDAAAVGGEDEEEEVNPQPGTKDSQPSDSSSPPPTPATCAGHDTAPVLPSAPRATRTRQVPKFLQEHYCMAW
jgi:hypothetical protein